LRREFQVSNATFIHTADLHLKESAEESLELLRWLLSKCAERGAALLVAGDLFDSETEAVHMRESVKEVFSEAAGVPKFILPGNRDAGAFPEGIDYGPAVYLLNGAPFTSGYHEEVEIVGFPFVPNSSLRAQLEEYNVPEKPLVALIHGTYFGRESNAFFQDVRERGDDYFPIYGCDLDDIDANYVALGHCHARHASFVRNDIVVCYPGTPVALSSRETGIRTAVAVSVDALSGEVNIERLPVPVGVYNIREDMEVFACEEEEALNRLEQSLRERADSRASMSTRLRGNIHWLERDMNDRLAALRHKYTGKYAKLIMRNETVSYRSLIDERPLVRDFMARLSAIEGLDGETKARALALGLRGFDRVKGHLR
jgi:DNA repair exonuclease SbcCD nuclease subunit